MNSAPMVLPGAVERLLLTVKVVSPSSVPKTGRKPAGGLRVLVRVLLPTTLPTKFMVPVMAPIGGMGNGWLTRRPSAARVSPGVLYGVCVGHGDLIIEYFGNISSREEASGGGIQKHAETNTQRFCRQVDGGKRYGLIRKERGKGKVADSSGRHAKRTGNRAAKPRGCLAYCYRYDIRRALDI